MSTKFEDWDESILDVEDYQVERALTNAALAAIYRARFFGTDYVIEEDGKAKSVRPEETGPYEEKLLEDLDRLNRKIAELKGEPPPQETAARTRKKKFYARTKSQGGKLDLSFLPFDDGEEVEIIIRAAPPLTRSATPIPASAYW